MAIVKKLKQHPPLPPSRYEVGIYCRVSTASKTQVVSIGHQLSGLILLPQRCNISFFVKEKTTLHLSRK